MKRDFISQSWQLIPGTPLRLTREAYLLWKLSPQLQKSFPLTNTENMIDFCVYAEDVLQKEYPYLPILETIEERKFIHAPVNDMPLAPTHYMMGLLKSREYLQSCDILTYGDRLRLWKHVSQESSLLTEDPYFYAASLQAKVDIDGFSLPFLVYMVIEHSTYILKGLNSLQEVCAWLLANQSSISWSLDKKLVLPTVLAILINPQILDEQERLLDIFASRIFPVYQENYNITIRERLAQWLKRYTVGSDISVQKACVTPACAVQIKKVCQQTSYFNSNRSFFDFCMGAEVFDEQVGFPLPLPVYFIIIDHMYIFPELKDVSQVLAWINNTKPVLDSFLAGWPDVQTSFAQDKTHEKTLSSLFLPRQASGSDVSDPPHNATNQKAKKGINVVGYGLSELGIGEDARSALRNCDTVGISACLHVPNLNISSRSKNLEYRSRTTDTFPYAVNLYCLPLSEFIRTTMIIPPSQRKGKVQVVAPPWELSRLPDELRLSLQFADELWAPSAFVAQALKEATNKSVVHMPHSVVLPKASSKTRDDFKLPKSAFLFLFIFDWLSWPQRKNPEAAISAFLRAFSRQDNVGFVIKTMNAPQNLQKLADLVPAQDIGSRFFIIDETLDAPDLAALYGVCDAYVSLHRSEGFGRTIAEAMLAGLPVVTTGYSGNLDFCSEETAFLVKGQMKPLFEGDYLFWEGQHWYDPSLEDAVRCMRLCASDRVLAKEKAKNGYERIATVHSPQAIGKRYVKRLGELLDAFPYV